MTIIFENKADALIIKETESGLHLFHHSEIIISTGKTEKDKSIIIRAMQTIEGNHKKLGLNYEILSR